MGLLDRLRGALTTSSTDEKRPTTEPAPGARPEWIVGEDWRSWEPPLDIVTGESHYQPALQTIAGPPRPPGWLVPCEAELLREPENRYDPDAIAVLIGGRKVGYISAEACGDIAPGMDEYGDNAQARGIPALVRGGWPDKPSLGVLLWLNHKEVLESLPAVDWTPLIDEFTCRHWPPADARGVGGGVSTSTGQGRSTNPGHGFTGEPRMPPLTDHYSNYVEDVKVLKRRKDHAAAEKLLLALIDAAEEESRNKEWGVAPWYYEQLAIVRRKLGDREGEVAILERYAAMPRAPGASSGKLLARLDDARARREAGK